MKNLFAVVFLTYSFVCLAQDEPISTDRPTQSASAIVVKPGHLLVETGFLSEKPDSDVTNITFFNASLRWGIIEDVELRLTQNIVGRKTTETNTGLSPFTVGTKIHLLDEHEWKPQMSVLGQVTLKTGSSDFKPTSSVAQLRINFQNTLSERFALGYNIGYENSGFNEYLYSLVFGISLIDGLSAFVEPYGFFGDKMDQRFNAGLIYLVKPHLQFDMSFGSGLSRRSPDSFVGFGVAFGLN